MRFFILILLLSTGLIFLACETESPLEIQNDQVVIQGYLYANESVQDIRITRTLPIGSDESDPPPINDASVRLIKDGQSYTLVPIEGDSGYYEYPDNDLSVETGDVFGIEVDYFGTTRTLYQHIAQLRKKVEPVPAEPRYLVTVHGIGYRYLSDGGA